MNLQEFAALKPGDKIENHLSGSSGTITEVKPMGVHVRWGVQEGNVVSFFYSVQGTTWFHWTLAEPEMTAEKAEELTRRAT
jgi:hypothetical protein